MDTFKFYVFVLTYITLIFVQSNVDATLGVDCTTDASLCDTTANEICDGVCRCNTGYYQSGAVCASNNALKPIGLRNTKTHNSVSLSWTSPAASGYTNSHVINYSVQGGAVQTQAVYGQDVYTTVPGLSSGTTYIFTVVRSITGEGRKQSVPASDPYPVITNGVYSDSCTAVGATTECGSDLVCVSASSANKCLCQNGNYYTGSICTTTDNLKPTGLTSSSQTHNSVTLVWTSPDASGYTDSHVINYGVQGGPVETHNVNNQDTFTTVSGLSQGTTYTFTVVRSITRYGRIQNVQASDTVQAATKLDYGGVCSVDQCRSILSCIAAKCLCAEGSYYTGDSCISTATLKPSILSTQPTSTTSVTINWSSPPAGGYINSYVIKYTEVGTADLQTTTTLGDVASHLVTGLTAATSYTFVVVRSITREGRTQTVMESDSRLGTSEKINYGDSCPSTGTCKNSNTDCYSSSCRCDLGNFWEDTTCLPNANLSPGNVNTETVSTTQLRVTWTVSAYTEVVTGYLVELSPSVSSENIVITGTSATISSLTAGERYMITVKSRSNYLDRGETAPATAVPGITKPAPTSGLAPATTLMEPVAQIHFYKAEGRADSYTVTLSGDGYNVPKSASGPGDTLSADFPGVAAGLYYTLTIITYSFGVSSDPFTMMVRIKAEVPERVVGLSFSDVTSRSASLIWKRPINTKGALYKYGIEVFNSSTCVQRINVQCTECPQPMNVNEWSETSCGSEKNVTISQSDLNNVNFPVLYYLSLLPSTIYQVSVAAYNEEGKGVTDQVSVQTEQEAPGDPTYFRFVSKTSESVELTWTPPIPRPGVTEYLIRVYEWDETSSQYVSFRNTSNVGFYDVVNNITGLSSFWKYKFEMHAKTSKGLSNTSYVPEVTTEESAPIAVENLQHQPIDGVYNQYQLFWRCPPQKDGRNGVIRSATVIKSSMTQSADINPAIGDKQFDNTDCTWSERVTVTPEFNYTFEVYISNSIKGESTTIQQYMPPGAPLFIASEKTIMQVKSGTETEKSVELLICPTCLLDNTNGVIVKSGILVCAKGDCPIRDAKKKADDFDQSPNWDTTSGVRFTTWYRVTEDDWLKGKEASEEVRFVLGGESCGVQDQNRFCNGPLPVDRTYRVWLFACTRVSCSEGDHLEFTLRIPVNDDSLSGSFIAAIVIAAVLVILAVVILVVYIKVIRPRSQRQRRTQYETDTSPKDETYDEIGGGNRLSVIQDGQPEADYYNTKDCRPRSENNYDQLIVYSNEGHHDYGRIKDTQT